MTSQFADITSSTIFFDVGLFPIPILSNICKIVIPNLSRMSLMKCYYMLWVIKGKPTWGRGKITSPFTPILGLIISWQRFRICRGNHWTGFHIIGTFVIKELNKVTWPMKTWMNFSFILKMHGKESMLNHQAQFRSQIWMHWKRSIVKQNY